MDLQHAFSYTDERSFNLLMLAAEQGNIPAIGHFLAIGMDVNSTVNHETAAELAYLSDHYEALLLLLQHNSLFPPNFNIEMTDNEDLRRFASTMEEFHDHSQNDRRDEMTRIAMENPQLCHFYTTHNISAPAVALFVKDFDLYEFLITLNITIGPFEI
jgi:ankyrin repeat protein